FFQAEDGIRDFHVTGVQTCALPISPDALPYLTLLQRNYIGMHGAVMYPRWIFDSFRYDTSLKACEDYDLYLKIAEKHPVLYHRRSEERRVGKERTVR